jgi:hypothetical protein
MSVGAVMVETRVLKGAGVFGPPKTANFVLPNKRQYKTLEIFPLKVEISGVETPINAVQIDLGFDPKKLQAIKISIDDSFANIFIDQQIDNEKGFVRITGGLSNPGFSDKDGTFATIYFQGQTPGPAQVAFLPSSLVMANDGRGSNILSSYETINYLILAESLSKPDQDSQIINLTNSKVLGASTETDKLIFFDQTGNLKPKVLGATTDKPKTSILTKAVKVMELYDLKVMAFWKKIFSWL